MKIAITGGSGFIGNWLISELYQKNDLLILGRNNNIKNSAISNYTYSYAKTNYSVLELTELLRGVDSVVHLAAIRIGSNNLNDYLPNITLPNNLFESCLAAGVSNVVALSSISVYSSLSNLPWNEEQRIVPLTYYGVSKATMENLAEYYNIVHGMKIKCLRVARVLGLYELPGFMLNTFIDQAFKKETIKIFGQGAGRREYIYVRDVAASIQNALLHSEIGGLFNIGTGKNISHAELAILINRVFDNIGNQVFVSSIKEDKSEYLMNINKAKLILSWEPKWTIEKGLYDIKNILEQQKI